MIAVRCGSAMPDGGSRSYLTLVNKKYTPRNSLSPSNPLTSRNLLALQDRAASTVGGTIRRVQALRDIIHGQLARFTDRVPFCTESRIGDHISEPVDILEQ